MRKRLAARNLQLGCCFRVYGGVSACICGLLLQGQKTPKPRSGKISHRVEVFSPASAIIGKTRLDAHACRAQKGPLRGFAFCVLSDKLT